MTASVDDNHVVIVGGTTPDVTAMEVVDVSSSNNNHSTSLVTEIWMSSEMLFSNKLSWLLILGPVALIGESSGHLGEAACFALSGIALIPCAERLSFVTEQVAEHTNGTIGALLNATFGNAPELLIATAALRNGFYRVVQLAMLGSMLTNLLFVFGMSCVVGGCRYQVQELRITSGNVNVGMLLLSVSGSLLPAALILGGQLKTESTTTEQQQQQSSSSSDIPSPEELHFCRVNAVVMIFMYGCYLLFQLGTHKEEFDEEPNNEDNFQDLHGNNKTRRNKFCLWLYHKLTQLILRCRRNNNSSAVAGGADYMPAANDDQIVFDDDGDLEMLPAKATHYKDHVLNGHINNNNNSRDADGHSSMSSGHGGGNAVDALEALGSDSDSSDGGPLLPQNEVSNNSHANGYFDEYNELATTKSKSTLPNNNKDASDSSKVARRRRKKGNGSSSLLGGVDHLSASPSLNHRSNSKDSLQQYQQPGRLLPLGLADPTEEPLPPPPPAPSPRAEPLMSFRVGIIWLFVITLCISALSDILVDTIDGFAKRLHLSEVFTSMVIVPYFSNVAEQVSAVLFAYRNEMDLCVGVTVGSAIQVACFVLPGSVLIGMFVDRSMTLYFHAYETVCLFLAVVVVAAVLQGGSTNWLVGTMLIGIYIMIASGFWFHTLEDLTVDAELAMHGGG